MLLQGIFPILLTPFDPAGAIDEISFHRLVQDTLAHGIQGLAGPAVASEVDKLSPAERARLIDLMVAETAGRVPVIGGVIADTGPAAAALAAAYLRRGCSALLARAPEPLAANRAAWMAYFRDIAATGVPHLILQDLAWAGTGVPVDWILDLAAELPALRAVKIETALTGWKASQLFARAPGRLAVWSGWAATQMIEALDRGIQGFNVSAYHVVFQRILAAYQARDRPRALALFEQILPYLAWSRQHIDINLRLLKIYLVRRGLFAHPHLRPPHLPWDPTHQACADELVPRMLAWEA